MTRTSASGLPWLNTPVLVSVPGVEHELRSRVEDVRGELVVIAAVRPGRRGRAGEGEILSLAWAMPPRGLVTTSCVLEQVEETTPPLWVLRPFGEMRRLQRRRFTRADVSSKVALSGLVPMASPPAEWVATGTLGDLGEGGARILLDTGQRVPAVLDCLVVDLLVDGEVLVTPATVVGREALAHGRHQVRVEFHLTERESGRVRRAVMQRQLEARCREDKP